MFLFTIDHLRILAIGKWYQLDETMFHEPWISRDYALFHLILKIPSHSFNFHEMALFARFVRKFEVAKRDVQVLPAPSHVHKKQLLYKVGSLFKIEENRSAELA